MEHKTFIELLPENTAALIIPLHQIATENGCRFRMDEDGDTVTLTYSARNFKIKLQNGSVSFSGEYDPRAFYKLYSETANDKVNELLFNASEACSLCINDKCTAFLMADKRTIEWNGNKKKLCGPYRHHLSIDVSKDKLDACVSVAGMMFEYTLPHMHTDVFYKNEVTYHVVKKESFFLVGYIARHNSLSKSDEDLVRSVLSDKAKTNALKFAIRKEDNTECRYIGAIDKFIDGNTYEFLFGIMTDVRPAVLPDGVICRKINAGEWVVYNSSADDYKSIWKHFTSDFYNAERKGYDRSRIPFEFYDPNGRLHDVHIPVDADCGADSGKSVRMLEIPVMRVAGFSWYNEADHPQGENYGFDITQRMKEAFPLADRHFGICTHAFFGKPMRHGCFYIYDDLDVIPDTVNKYNFSGGRWIIESYHHFNGNMCEYPFGRAMNFKVSMDDMHHPGPWLDIHYLGARGGYVEFGNPAQIKGKRKYELVELPPQRVAGKLEAPPESVVTDEEKNAFYTLSENKEKGSYVIGYTVTVPESKGMYFDRPLVKGVLLQDGTPVPENLREFYLDGGRYIRVTEDVPNGEPGWEIEGFAETAKEAGYIADSSRQFIVKQNDFGKSYEWFIPCMRQKTEENKFS